MSKVSSAIEGKRRCLGDGELIRKYRLSRWNISKGNREQLIWDSVVGIRE
ncbi:hypothetical protein [Moorena sp. SIO3H5]|nr:hypothetical protein [Moorena sp. SIO3H5]NEO70873.1 hypothetical protein [Moorena sp. SIO3H5]